MEPENGALEDDVPPTPRQWFSGFLNQPTALVLQPVDRPPGGGTREAGRSRKGDLGGWEFQDLLDHESYWILDLPFFI